jgi:hypothetical protein
MNDLTYCTDLEVAGGAWGCSSTNAQPAVAAGLGPGRFGDVRERVDAGARVVFFGPLFGHKPQGCIFLPQGMNKGRLNPEPRGGGLAPARQLPPETPGAGWQTAFF